MDTAKLLEQKALLANKLDTDTIKMLDAYVYKDFLGLNNEDVAGLVGKKRNYLQKILRDDIPKEYIKICQQIREVDNAFIDDNTTDTANALEVFTSIKNLLFTKAMSGDSKAVDMMLRYHSTLTAIEERHQEQISTWEATQENVQELINELEAEAKYDLRTQGYIFTVIEPPAEHIRLVIELLGKLYQIAKETPTDALHSEEMYSVKRFYFELTSTVKTLLQGYGVTAERITKL